LKNNSNTKLKVFLKGMTMGIADVIPGVSGGTIALITGIYEELINSIDHLNLKALSTLKKEGFNSFWNKINGKFLLPLLLGIGTSIVLFSGLIHHLLNEYPIPVWSFFFGLITSSILLLLKQYKPNSIKSILFLLIGLIIAFSITQITPKGGEISLAYLFFCSMIAIIAMILPGISGSFIYILLGAYETVIYTSKNSILALLNFDWENFLLIYSRLAAIGLGIIVGLKAFSKILKWLFNHKKQETLMVLIGFMTGALPKIWPWQKVVQWGTISETKKIALKTEYTTPWNFDGESHTIIAFTLMSLGFLFLYFLERNSSKENNATQ
jgi:putative membrane protein